MNRIMLILMLMNTFATVAQNTKATTTRKAFSRDTTVSTFIAADAAIVWTLLTNASNYPRWNSTIPSIEGEIKGGEKIKLRSTLDEKRVFKLKVKDFKPEKLLVWGDGKGNRVFTISKEEGGLRVIMQQKIGGLMFPMYAKYIPSFDESFNQFISDLKNEAEAILETK